MAKRIPIPLRIRTEVLKRDAFTCQYCGRKPPEVVLEIDHIKPVAKGGTNDIINLVTACRDCNRGKSDIELDDNTIISKQRKQLEELNEKQQQLKMMVEWREELSKMSDTEIDTIVKLIRKETSFLVGEDGKRAIKNLIRRYKFSEAYECVELAIAEYYYDAMDFDALMKKANSIAKHRKNDGNDPYLYTKNKLCKYASKKFAKDYDRQTLLSMLNKVNLQGYEETMFMLFKEAQTWEDLLYLVEEQISFDEEREEIEKWQRENGSQKSS